MAKPDSLQPKALRGHLESFSEPGHDGVYWAFREEGTHGKAFLRPLKNGDVLRVFNDAARKNEIWSGTVELDFKAHSAPVPHKPHLTAQNVPGHGIVHGLQKDTEPKKWADMFLTGKPALLIPRTENPNP